MTIETLITWLEKIAKKNDDSFYYRINIQPTKQGLEFTFECRESADNHEFVGGMGDSIEEAIANAVLGIAESCEDWDYEFVPQPQQQ